MVAIFLIAISFYLVFTQNSFQRNVYLSSSNYITGELYRMSGKIASLVHMQKNNEALLEENARLRGTLEFFKNHLSISIPDSLHNGVFLNDSIHLSQFDFIPANVVNVSFSGVNNFITLDKGTLDGIMPDMGVISQSGVAGVVLHTSDHFSVVIPIINPKFRLSAKLSHSENSGSVAWDGKSLRYAQIQELPKHEPFHAGDTVLTSFSRIFPKGLVIGVVTEKGISRDDNFNTFHMKLATDFYSLRNVLVIKDIYYDEQSQLENSINQ